MKSRELFNLSQTARRWQREGVSYDELDAFCREDITQNKLRSQSLDKLLESIFIGNSQAPVFHNDAIRFDSAGTPVVSLPNFLSYRDCPANTIPGHRRDREIFTGFYPVIGDNPGLYFRIALAWLSDTTGSYSPVLLHLSNRDFDSMHRVKMLVPVITILDNEYKMDLAAMSMPVFMKMQVQFQEDQDRQQYFFQYNPRSGQRHPVPLKDQPLSNSALDAVRAIREDAYLQFYERMLDFIRNRHVSTGAYTCGQFLLDLYMRH